MLVLLHWENKSCAKGHEPIACGNEIPRQPAPFVCSVGHEFTPLHGGTGRCIGLFCGWAIAGAGRDHPAEARPRAARQLGWPVEVLPADWRRHGRAAGPIRNRELLELAISRAVALASPAAPVAVLVVAFPGGAGTASLVQQARRIATSSPVPIAVAQISQAPALP